MRALMYKVKNLNACIAGQTRKDVTFTSSEGIHLSYINQKRCLYKLLSSLLLSVHAYYEPGTSGIWDSDGYSKANSARQTT